MFNPGNRRLFGAMQLYKPSTNPPLIKGQRSLHQYEYETLDNMITRLLYFTGEICNHKRLRSPLCYCPPNEFEELILIELKKGLTAGHS